MLVKASLLSLSLVAFTGHTSWPISQGHHLQPTQLPIDHTESDNFRQHDRSAQRAVDQLYEVIMRAAVPGAPRR